MNRTTTWALLTAGGALALTAATAGGYAAASDPPQEVVHACANSSNGALRLVAADEACRNSERPVSWNAAGTKGDVGDKGETGPAGPQGVAGPQGEPFPNGPVTADQIAEGAVLQIIRDSGGITSDLVRDGDIRAGDLAGDEDTVGAVTSEKIMDGTVESRDLAPLLITTSLIADGAVTSAKLADGGVQTQDLAAGAVTSDRLRASYGTSSQGPTAGHTGGSVATALLDQADSAAHAVLLTGQAQLSCSSCPDPVAVTYRLVRDGVAVSPDYTVPVGPGGAVAPVSTVVVATTGLSEYGLEVTSPVPLNVSGAVLSAVDLGRA